MTIFAQPAPIPQHWKRTSTAPSVYIEMAVFTDWQLRCRALFIARPPPWRLKLDIDLQSGLIGITLSAGQAQKG
jgi:hypothetical protein